LVWRRSSALEEATYHETADYFAVIGTSLQVYPRLLIDFTNAKKRLFIILIQNPKKFQI
jgi:NAD-dependent deacetylase